MNERFIMSPYFYTKTGIFCLRGRGLWKKWLTHIKLVNVCSVPSERARASRVITQEKKKKKKKKKCRNTAENNE